MTTLNILFRYKAIKYIALFAAACLLSGCLGGTIAQQIVRSIATKVADKAIANAMDVQDGPSNRKPKDTYAAQNNNNGNNNASAYQNAMLSKQATIQSEPDAYRFAIANTAFEPAQPIAEALPEETEEVETRINVMQGNQLVQVELFNMLIGDEKNAVYEQARLIGATGLPQKREWQSWGVGTGEIKTATINNGTEKSKKIITFLIPPEIGKMPSGATALVELASPGELNVVRYKTN
jgi:hypothetical protein